MRSSCPSALNCVCVSMAITMPMNAPVTAMTGTERTPTSYISGNSVRMSFQRNHPVHSQRNVRPAKTQKSPKAASVLFVLRPTCSIHRTGMVRDDKNERGWVVEDDGRKTRMEDGGWRIAD